MGRHSGTRRLVTLTRATTAVAGAVALVATLAGPAAANDRAASSLPTRGPAGNAFYAPKSVPKGAPGQLIWSRPIDAPKGAASLEGPLPLAGRRRS